MSLTTTTTQIQHVGNGSAVEFAYNFKVFDQTHLEVWLDNGSTKTILTLNSDYTVEGVGEETGGIVTMSEAPDSGDIIIIQRRVPLTQDTTYLENDAFPAETHENALDKLTMIAQQAQDGVDRALKVPDTETPVPDMTLPSAADRASKALGFGSSGELATITLDPAGGFLADVWVLNTSLLQALDDTALLDGQIVGVTCHTSKGDDGGGYFYLDTDGLAADADNGITFPSLSGYLWRRILGDRRVSVKWYGATGDGATDDQPMVQAALEGLVNTFGGGELVFPRGTYYLNTMAEGDMVSGGALLKIGDALGSVPHLTFSGAGAVLKQHIDPGASGTGRIYATLGIYDGVTEVIIDGLTFYSSATTTPANCLRDAVRFMATDNDRPIKLIKIRNCVFRNHCRPIILLHRTGDYNLGTTTQRYEYVHIDSNKFIWDNGADSGGDTSDVAPEVGIIAYENTDEIIISNNLFDGCVSGDVTEATLKRAWDGFVFMRQPTRCVIAHNIIKHFAVEGIYVIGNYPGINKVSRECIIANNEINGTHPTGADVSGVVQYGIRCDVPYCVISGNQITNLMGQGITCSIEGGGTNYPYECRIIGNNISLNGTHDTGAGVNGEIGIFVNYGRAVIEGNTVSVDEYTGATGNIVGIQAYGAGLANGRNLITNNKIFAVTKLESGKTFIGVQLNENAVNSVVRDNTFLDINTAIDLVGAPHLIIDGNVFRGVTAVIAGTYTFCQFSRNHVHFTPTSAGWWRIGYGVFGFRGRFTVATDVPYGAPGDYVDRRTSYAEFTAMLSADNGGSATHAEIIQHAFTYYNATAYSAVRIWNTHAVEINIDALSDFSTLATEIVVMLDAAAPGMVPVMPVLNEASGTTNCQLNLGLGLRMSDRDNSSSAIDNMTRIGAYWLWVDADGKLRINSTKPSSITDGTIVGTQTA